MKRWRWGKMFAMCAGLGFAASALVRWWMGASPEQAAREGFEWGVVAAAVFVSARYQLASRGEGCLGRPRKEPPAGGPGG